MYLKNATLKPFYRAKHSNIKPGVLIELEIETKSKEEAGRFASNLRKTFDKVAWSYLYGQEPVFTNDNIVDVTIPLDYINGGLTTMKDFYFVILDQNEVWQRIEY